MNDRVSRLYCHNSKCELRSMQGSFDRNRNYKCPQCGRRMSQAHEHARESN